jgi:hypothetical protein
MTWCGGRRAVYGGCVVDVSACLPACQVASEPCYDTLRTKQQLGYTVHCGMRLTHGVLGFCIVVVSGAFPNSCVAVTAVVTIAQAWTICRGRAHLRRSLS